VARTRTRSELLAISGEAPSTVNASWPNGYANRMRVTRSRASFAILSQVLPWNLNLKAFVLARLPFAVSLNLEHHSAPERIAEEFFAMSKEKPGSPNARQFCGQLAGGTHAVRQRLFNRRIGIRAPTQR